MRTTLANFHRSLVQGFWLGWQIESNWARPWLFALYTLVKPLAATLLLVFMFRAAALVTQREHPDLYAFAFVGNTLYMLVGAIAQSMTTAIIQDRETYGMLRYVRVSPVNLEAWLIGRGLAGGLRALIGALWTLTLGFLLPLGLRELFDPAQIAWGNLGLGLLLGMGLLLGLGLVMAAIAINTARHGIYLGEGVSSALYLLSGAIFPLAMLPGWLQGVAMFLPPTLWLEALRRCLLQRPGAGPLETWADSSLWLVLTLASFGLLLVGWTLFRLSDYNGRRSGKYDMTTGF